MLNFAIFIVILNPQLRKNPKSAFPSNFDFLGINSPAVYGNKFILGAREQTAKISKTGFAKIGYTAVSKP